MAKTSATMKEDQVEPIVCYTGICKVSTSLDQPISIQHKWPSNAPVEVSFVRLSNGNDQKGHKATCFIGKLDYEVAACVQNCAYQSQIFRKRFCQYSKCVCKRKRLTCLNKHLEVCDIDQRNMTVIVLIITEPIKPIFDYRWNFHMSCLIWKKLQLEDAMNWLNTLGGGYSALGEYYEDHALQAGRISSKQLKIALEMGDPPTVIRCMLYLALSLMQRGQLRRAKHMLRFYYVISVKNFSLTDRRLVNMCFGLWSRLQYLYRTRKGRTVKNGKTVYS